MSKESAESGDSGHHGNIQDFIFTSELAEVYLLLDNLSTSTAKALPGADTQPPFEKVNGDGDWIEEICKIGWPPDGTRAEKAAKAAKLVKARDYLNRLAAPATGATIAFTLLVAGEDDDRRGGLRSWLRRLMVWTHLSRQPHDEEAPKALATQGWGGDAPSRGSLARLAFPGLIGRASAFRWQLPLLVYALFFWLLITCVVSWNVASGNAILARLTAVDTERAEVNKQMDDVANGIKSSGATPGQSGSQAQTAPQDSAKPIMAYCERHPALPDPSDKTPKYDSYAQLRICQRHNQVTEDEQDAQALLKDWLRNWRWLPHIAPKAIAHPIQPASANLDTGRGQLPDSGAERQFAIMLAGVLGGTVLPVAYGILGAAAAVVRGLSMKMKESLLSPRDLVLSLVQLALGAVIGGCVGLFLTPAGGGGGSSSGLFGPVPLSASALSFIAGFGVESVFVALEGLMSRVFNVTEPAKKAS